MSGTGSSPANRLLDEFGRVHLFSSWKYRSHEETNISSPPISAPLYGSNLENHRMSKIARPDCHESDKRSPSPHIFRNFSSPGEPHTGNYVKSEIRAETRDSAKEGNMNLMDGECARDLKEENRGLCKDLRKECSVSDNKGETDANMKDRNQELEGRNDPSISESSAGNNNLFRKEFKEYNRGCPYLENSSGLGVGGLESWYIPRPVVQPQAEVRKETVICENECQESYEAVGENKIELKGEDKLKEKDRKRKDGKHYDLGEKDRERSDYGNFQFGNSSVEFVDSVMENIDGDKWERARKYLIKDKEKKPKDKDSGNPKIELGANNSENDSSHYHGMGGVQSFIRKQEHHEMEKESLKQKDFDGLKNLDKEVMARKNEKDIDVEGDTMEVQTTINEKEMEDGGIHVDNSIGREKEAFPYEVQHRKRMVRTRGGSQPINRELRVRSHSLELDGLQGKTEMAVVVYNVGECMHELEKLWKDYECSQNWVNGDCSQGGPTLAIRILAGHITATNRQVRGGQLWGTDVYTDDSDLVAVLMHTGYCRPTASPPPHNVLELYTTIKVLAPQDCYISTLRNNVRSRAWGSAICCSYRVESCCIVLRDGGKINLEPCLTHTSTVEPTLAPVVVERSMTTRAAASNALRQQRFVREVTIQYNLCNEPWIKYSISIVADKGLKKPLYTSARLKKGDVLYLETPSCRYELCFSCEKIIKASTSAHEMEVDRRYIHDSHNSNDDKKLDGENMIVDVYRWSWCKTPIPQKLMQEIGIPLPSQHVEVLADNVEWENVQWSQTGVWVAGREYTIARVHFLSPL